MKAPEFIYVRAGSLEEAFRAKAAHGPDSRWLAGGQSLLAALAFRLSEPAALIDVSRIAELQGITVKGGKVRIGAGTTQTVFGASEAIKKHLPMLAEAIPLIAHAAIRNRGTIGGSLAFADPAAELPACAVALGATIVAANAEGERRIAARDFFRGTYETALREGGASAVAAASIFHFTQQTPLEAKDFLATHGIPVRRHQLATDPSQG